MAYQMEDRMQCMNLSNSLSLAADSCFVGSALHLVEVLRVIEHILTSLDALPLSCELEKDACPRVKALQPQYTPLEII